ncbi:MAG: cyclic nucleotide-binding domain-containing protein [Acidimicrobiales bacterium]
MFRRINPIPTPLSESALAEAVPARELQVLQSMGTAVRIAAGRTAMVENAVGRECMVVVDGSFVVERDGEWIADLVPGDFMGEIALLTSQPRNATVTATHDSIVYAFSRREFTSLLRACPAISARVLEGVDERLLVA